MRRSNRNQDDSSSMYSNHKDIETAKQYCTAHHIEELFSDTLNVVVRERSDEPFRRISHLISDKVVTKITGIHGRRYIGPNGAAQACIDVYIPSLTGRDDQTLATRFICPIIPQPPVLSKQPVAVSVAGERAKSPSATAKKGKGKAKSKGKSSTPIPDTDATPVETERDGLGETMPPRTEVVIDYSADQTIHEINHIVEPKLINFDLLDFDGIDRTLSSLLASNADEENRENTISPSTCFFVSLSCALAASQRTGMPLCDFLKDRFHFDGPPPKIMLQIFGSATEGGEQAVTKKEEGGKGKKGEKNSNEKLNIKRIYASLGDIVGVRKQPQIRSESSMSEMEGTKQAKSRPSSKEKKVKVETKGKKKKKGASATPEPAVEEEKEEPLEQDQTTATLGATQTEPVEEEPVEPTHISASEQILILTDLSRAILAELGLNVSFDTISPQIPPSSFGTFLDIVETVQRCLESDEFAQKHNIPPNRRIDVKLHVEMDRTREDEEERVLAVTIGDKQDIREAARKIGELVVGANEGVTEYSSGFVVSIGGVEGVLDSRTTDHHQQGEKEADRPEEDEKQAPNYDQMRMELEMKSGVWMDTHKILSSSKCEICDGISNTLHKHSFPFESSQPKPETELDATLSASELGATQVNTDAALDSQRDTRMDCEVHRFGVEPNMFVVELGRMLTEGGRGEKQPLNNNEGEEEGGERKDENFAMCTLSGLFGLVERERNGRKERIETMKEMKELLFAEEEKLRLEEEERQRKQREEEELEAQREEEEAKEKGTEKKGKGKKAKEEKKEEPKKEEKGKKKGGKGAKVVEEEQVVEENLFSQTSENVQNYLTHLLRELPTPRFLLKADTTFLDSAPLVDLAVALSADYVALPHIVSSTTQTGLFRFDDLLFETAQQVHEETA